MAAEVQIDPALAREAFCYLTTIGRVTGKPREIEIWFGLDRATLYMLSGGGDRSDWVRNLRHTPSVMVRISNTTYSGQARVVDAVDEDALARRLLVDKYRPRYSGDLTNWGSTALPVAVDLAPQR
ncbi:MAG: nitroreductase family deazaflavin-dependent oxidoreductase [Dehalococcoidia bacterium]